MGNWSTRFGIGRVVDSDLDWIRKWIGPGGVYLILWTRFYVLDLDKVCSNGKSQGLIVYFLKLQGDFCLL